MDFNQYQKEAGKTLLPHLKGNLSYFALGISGEAGEIADKVKKIYRDKNGVLDDETKMMLAKEVGDVLWYLSQFADLLGFDFEEIAKMNIEKLKSRKQRGTLHGDGDNR